MKLISCQNLHEGQTSYKQIVWILSTNESFGPPFKLKKQMSIDGEISSSHEQELRETKRTPIGHWNNEH